MTEPLWDTEAGPWEVDASGLWRRPGRTPEQEPERFDLVVDYSYDMICPRIVNQELLTVPHRARIGPGWTFVLEPIDESERLDDRAKRTE